ncbi:MAG: hypothetical protein WA728_20400 [Xanthobacteraceae bacterium]
MADAVLDDPDVATGSAQAKAEAGILVVENDILDCVAAALELGGLSGNGVVGDQDFIRLWHGRPRRTRIGSRLEAVLSNRKQFQANSLQRKIADLPFKINELQPKSTTGFQGFSALITRLRSSAFEPRPSSWSGNRRNRAPSSSTCRPSMLRPTPSSYACC